MMTPRDGLGLPPDWYPDLDDLVERYWDGQAWTESRPLRDVATSELIRSQRRTQRSVRWLITIVVVIAAWVAIALLLHNLTK